MAWVNNIADLGIRNVVEDTSPELGGELNAANNKIVNLAAPASAGHAARKADIAVIGNLPNSVQDSVVMVEMTDADQENGISFITIVMKDGAGNVLNEQVLFDCWVCTQNDFPTRLDVTPAPDSGATYIGQVHPYGGSRILHEGGASCVVASQTPSADDYQFVVAVGGKVFIHDFTTTGSGGGE